MAGRHWQGILCLNPHLFEFLALYQKNGCEDKSSHALSRSCYFNFHGRAWLDVPQACLECSWAVNLHVSTVQRMIFMVRTSPFGLSGMIMQGTAPPNISGCVWVGASSLTSHVSLGKLFKMEGHRRLIRIWSGGASFSGVHSPHTPVWGAASHPTGENDKIPCLTAHGRSGMAKKVPLPAGPGTWLAWALGLRGSIYGHVCSCPLKR